MAKTVWIINQYASTPSTGMGGRHYYLAKELAKQGYKVYVIASSAHHLLREKQNIKNDYLIEEVEGVNFVWLSMPSYVNAHSKQRAINWFLFAWRLRKLSKAISDKPDTILCSSPSPVSFIGARRLAKRFKSRLVFEVRDIWPLSLIEIGGFSPKHPFIRIMQWIEDKAYSCSDSVISNLKNSVVHMTERGMNPRKFSWVPNGFSLDEVSQEAPLNDYAKSQLPKEKFIVGYTGSIGLANALDTLVLAADKLKKYSDIAFVMVGAGKEKSSLQSIVKEKGLSNVYFIDPIPKVEIQAMLNRFNACYIGLKKDPLFHFGVSPNKLFDYLYSGRPIIYGIESGNYEPVSDASAGIQIPAQDSSKLAEAVLQLYSMTEAERSLMGSNGRNVALEQYEYGKLAEKLSSVLFVK